MIGARMPLDRLTIYHLATPLTRPYRLSFGAVNRFDTFIALAVFADGTCRIGESTPLPGYSHETAELMSREYGLLARHGLLKAFLDRNRSHPFVTAPILTCLDPTLLPLTPTPLPSGERIRGEGDKRPVAGQVLLCPILQWDHPTEIAGRVAAL